ncbi:unnamed protein product, partial [Rotaria sp. Silwood1]
EPPVVTGIDAQVPDIIMKSFDEKKKFHISKKKRNTPNALNKKRKNLLLYGYIIKFDYEILKSIFDDEEEEFEKNKQIQKSWSTLVGRNGKKRMKKLLDKAKTTMTTTNLNTIIDDIVNITKVLTNPGIILVISGKMRLTRFSISSFNTDIYKYVGSFN